MRAAVHALFAVFLAGTYHNAHTKFTGAIPARTS